MVISDEELMRVVNNPVKYCKIPDFYKKSRSYIRLLKK